MAASEYSPEQLKAAVDKVTFLYMDDQADEIQGGIQGEEGRDQHWMDASNTHTPFADKIRSLRQSLKAVYKAHQAVPSYELVFSLPFSKLKDGMATMFLGDVLMARMMQTESHVDNQVKFPGEARQMAEEMGLHNNWHKSPDTKTTFDQVVEAVLVGKLRFQYQPKADQ